MGLCDTVGNEMKKKKRNLLRSMGRSPAHHQQWRMEADVGARVRCSGLYTRERGHSRHSWCATVVGVLYCRR